MADSNNSASGGIGFAGLLTIVFIALKLTHAIGWSWWWVLSPLWISALLTMVLILVVGTVWLLVSDRRRKAGRRD